MKECRIFLFLWLKNGQFAKISGLELQSKRKIMKKELFRPHLDILPKAQRTLWAEFVDVPADFILYGGTAVALHLGHRQSVDFDFFAKKGFNPLELATQLPFLRNAVITQSEPNTLGAVVDRGGSVKLSFFGVPKIPQLAEPCLTQDIHLKVADILDLAGTKVAVVQQRAEKKDYLDIDAILESGKVGLATALAAGKAIYGQAFNPESTLKALCYFDDGNVKTLDDEIRRRLVKAVKQVDLDKLPIIKPTRPDKANNKVKP